MLDQFSKTPEALSSGLAKGAPATSLITSIKDDSVQNGSTWLRLEGLKQLVDLVIKVWGVGQHLHELAKQEGTDRGLLVVVLYQRIGYSGDTYVGIFQVLYWAGYFVVVIVVMWIFALRLSTAHVTIDVTGTGRL